MFADFLIHIFNKAATGDRRIKTVLTPLGPVFFLGLIAALIVSSLYLDEKLGVHVFFPPFLRILTAALFAGGGLFLAIWSVSRFLRVGGTPVPFNPPPVLVRTGPYAVSRNPMLAGVFLILFGVGVFLDSVSLVFIITPLFILAMVWEVKKVEEPELIKRLGPQYLRYREEVPMFFPWLRRKKGPEGKKSHDKDNIQAS